jgi:multiple sugar transport system permease protein/alpha-1,4-digalacturonate transport system permease protein
MAENKIRKIKVQKRKLSRLEKEDALAGYLYLLPNFIGFLTFSAIPIVASLVISFSNYNGFPGAKLVGFLNYFRIFRDPQFIAALKNNLFYSAVSVPMTMLVALLLALMLNKAIPATSFFKTVTFFPSLTSMVAIGCIAMMLFDPAKGPVNQLLFSLGFTEETAPRWFFATKSALITIIITVVWKSAGYYMIMFMAGLKNIPAHLYEAARMDGANPWQCFWNVTWPMLSPTTFMIAILSLIGSFQVFDVINITTAGGPGRSTQVIVMRIYQEAFVNWKMGYASAMAYVLFIIILIVTLIQWQGQKAWVNDD